MGEVNKGRLSRLLALGCQLLLATAVVRAQSASEFEVKAAFLLNFAKFVEWPEAELPAEAPLHICIVGDDPFGHVLDQVVEGESVGTHKIVVTRIKAAGENGCHVAYFGKGNREVTKSKPGVLTVGEDEAFLRVGGMVAFVLDNRRVRFDVNLGAMRKGGVQASSRLLRVARAVKP